MNSKVIATIKRMRYVDMIEYDNSRKTLYVHINNTIKGESLKCLANEIADYYHTATGGTYILRVLPGPPKEDYLSLIHI